MSFIIFWSFRVTRELKPILRDFMMNCVLLKLWVSLLIPKMEDGNNFGVSIQAEVVKEITYHEDDAAKYYEEMTEFFTNRAKLCSKVIKYPLIVGSHSCNCLPISLCCTVISGYNESFYYEFHLERIHEMIIFRV